MHWRRHILLKFYSISFRFFWNMSYFTSSLFCSKNNQVEAFREIVHAYLSLPQGFRLGSPQHINCPLIKQGLWNSFQTISSRCDRNGWCGLRRTPTTQHTPGVRESLLTHCLCFQLSTVKNTLLLPSTYTAQWRIQDFPDGGANPK